MREGGEKRAVRKMGGFTDGGHYLVGVIRKICGFTDRRERFEEVIHEMGVFADGRCHLVGFVREKGGFADRGIPESRIHQSQNPGIQQSEVQ